MEKSYEKLGLTDLSEHARLTREYNESNK